jgi:DNA-binding transcriptional LysR family regulator
VHQLEQSLEAKLIDRSKRPWVLTPEGEVYYRGVRKFLQQYDDLEDEVRTLHTEVQGRVRVASIYSVGLSHMNRCIGEFISSYPKANVQLQYQHPEQVYELVDRDAVDLGLVSYAKSSRSVEAVTWREERMVLVCAPQHRFAEHENISLAELDGTSFVGFDQGLKIRQALERALVEQGVSVNYLMEFDNIETIKRAVEIGISVSLLPEPTVQRELQLGSLVAVPLLPLPDGAPLVRPLGIIHRRGTHLTRTARRLIESLQTSAQERTTTRQVKSAAATAS